MRDDRPRFRRGVCWCVVSLFGVLFTDECGTSSTFGTCSGVSASGVTAYAASDRALRPLRGRVALGRIGDHKGHRVGLKGRLDHVEGRIEESLRLLLNFASLQSQGGFADRTKGTERCVRASKSEGR